VAGLARVRWRELLPLAARGAAALVLGAAMLLGTNFALSGELAWTPGPDVFREHLRLPPFGFVFPRVEIGDRLSVHVPEDIATRHLVGVPWRRETARWFGHAMAISS
jgi:hypothetical protein